MTGETTIAASDTSPNHSEPAVPGHSHATSRVLPLALSSLGVVFGDIGTSPLYAFHDALAEAAGRRGISHGDILGVLSLALWALTLIVSLKYVLFLMRA